MKLYALSDGPPSTAVKMVLKYLNIPFEQIEVDYVKCDHRTDSYYKLNPQNEIPVLDDDGFYLSESVAIMQYLCDKYAPGTTLYPQDVKHRAIVNQRLCFNLAYFYNAIVEVIILPMFFDYERTERGMKKVLQGLVAFEEYLKRIGKRFVAGDNLTIADIALVCALSNLEAIEYDLSKFPLIEKWYANFKSDFPELWTIGEASMKEMAFSEKNHPDLTGMIHPIHPMRDLTK